LGHHLGGTWSGYGEGFYDYGLGCSSFDYPQAYRGWQPNCS